MSSSQGKCACCKVDGLIINNSNYIKHIGYICWSCIYVAHNIQDLKSIFTKIREEF